MGARGAGRRLAAISLGQQVRPLALQYERWRSPCADGGRRVPGLCSPYGVLDLAGSVSEWCSDRYEKDYEAESTAPNPTGPETGTTRVLRGGNWMSPSSWVRVTSRLGVEPGWPGPMLGFRCAEDD